MQKWGYFLISLILRSTLELSIIPKEMWINDFLLKLSTEERTILSERQNQTVLFKKKPLNVMQTLQQSDRDFHCIVSCLIRSLKSCGLMTHIVNNNSIKNKNQWLFLKIVEITNKKLNPFDNNTITVMSVL